MHSHRCGIDADSLFDFVGTFTRELISLVSLFCKEARVRIDCEDDDTTMVFPKISLSHLVLSCESSDCAGD
jgi:hypothetical protein